MKSLPPNLDLGEVIGALHDHWNLQVSSCDYLPVGFGGYHWVAIDTLAQRYFVTVDDLTDKPWLGATADQTFLGLSQALRAASALRGESGLDFVVGPLPTCANSPVHRLDSRYSVTVHPFLDAQTGQFSKSFLPSERSEVLHMLARLHQVDTTSVQLRTDAPFPERAVIEAALHELGNPWKGGPYSEPARAWFSEHAQRLTGQLKQFDRLSEACTNRQLVITHGEPHPGNVMRHEGTLLLIDWDTVAFAPPERDLWLIGADGLLDEYLNLTGVDIDESALALYRLAWDLSDVAAYIDQFRSPHVANADSNDAWHSLTESSWSKS